MNRNWLLAGGLLMVLSLVGLSGCQAGSPNVEGVANLNLSAQQQGIWVTGQGKVTVVPDVAILRLGIEAQETSVAQAQAQASRAMNDVMDALAGKGVAKKDIQTQFFNISKVTRWDDRNQREVVIRYRVTNIVAAKIRDIEKAGSVIDAVAQAGGDLTRIDSVSFSVDDPTAYSAEAREKAMADASSRAKKLAELAGVTLGKASYINESYSAPAVPSPVFFGMERAAVAETSISPGETEITVSVQVVYDIR